MTLQQELAYVNNRLTEVVEEFDNTVARLVLERENLLNQMEMEDEVKFYQGTRFTHNENTWMLVFNSTSNEWYLVNLNSGSIKNGIAIHGETFNDYDGKESYCKILPTWFTDDMGVDNKYASQEGKPGCS